MRALLDTMRSYGNDHDNQRITYRVDNSVVCHAWENRGSRDVLLTRILKECIDHVTEHNIRPNIVWCSTKIQKADMPSRLLSNVENIAGPEFKYFLQNIFKV